MVNKRSRRYTAGVVMATHSQRQPRPLLIPRSLSAEESPGGQRVNAPQPPPHGAVRPPPSLPLLRSGLICIQVAANATSHTTQILIHLANEVKPDISPNPTTQGRLVFPSPERLPFQTNTKQLVRCLRFAPAAASDPKPPENK